MRTAEIKTDQTEYAVKIGYGGRDPSPGSKQLHRARVLDTFEQGSLELREAIAEHEIRGRTATTYTVLVEVVERAPSNFGSSYEPGSVHLVQPRDVICAWDVHAEARETIAAREERFRHAQHDREREAGELTARLSARLPFDVTVTPSNPRYRFAGRHAGMKLSIDECRKLARVLDELLPDNPDYSWLDASEEN